MLSAVTKYKGTLVSHLFLWLICWLVSFPAFCGDLKMFCSTVGSSLVAPNLRYKMLQTVIGALSLQPSICVHDSWLELIFMKAMNILDTVCDPGGL